jgi:hypothetical protein
MALLTMTSYQVALFRSCCDISAHAKNGLMRPDDKYLKEMQKDLAKSLTSNDYLFGNQPT